MSRKRGFTLIELLVVVAIIGILASIIISSLNSARGKARNAKRNSDIEQLQIAFNLGLNQSFPSDGWYCVSTTCYGSGGWGNIPHNSTIDAYLAPYISDVSDPTDSTRGRGGYLYANPAGPWAGPYDGYAFPAGVYLNWNVEPPVTSTSCGKGKIYTTSSVANSSYVQCLLKID